MKESPLKKTKPLVAALQRCHGVELCAPVLFALAANMEVFRVTAKAWKHKDSPQTIGDAITGGQIASVAESPLTDPDAANAFDITTNEVAGGVEIVVTWTANETPPSSGNALRYYIRATPRLGIPADLHLNFTF